MFTSFLDSCSEGGFLIYHLLFLWSHFQFSGETPNGHFSALFHTTTSSKFLQLLILHLLPLESGTAQEHPKIVLTISHWQYFWNFCIWVTFSLDWGVLSSVYSIVHKTKPNIGTHPLARNRTNRPSKCC